MTFSLRTLQSTLYASNSTRHTPDPIDFAPLYTLHNSHATTSDFTLNILNPSISHSINSTPCTANSTLHARHSTHSTRHVPRTTFHTLALHALHFALYTLHCKLEAPSHKSKSYTCHTKHNLTASKPSEKQELKLVLMLVNMKSGRFCSYYFLRQGRFQHVSEHVTASKTSMSKRPYNSSYIGHCQKCTAQLETCAGTARSHDDSRCKDPPQYPTHIIKIIKSASMRITQVGVYCAMQRHVL